MTEPKNLTATEITEQPVPPMKEPILEALVDRELSLTVHIQLSMLDPEMLTSPDGKRIEVSLEAVCRLLSVR